MEILSTLGQMYMFILLVLLFIGSGLAVWSFINNFTSNNNHAKAGVQVKGKQAVQSKPGNNNTINNKPETDVKLGGFKIANNRWFKLAVFSLIGILICVALLGFASTNSMSGHNNMNMQNGMNGMQIGNIPMNNSQGRMK